MNNLRIFIKGMTTKGYWKHSGKTNKEITNNQRMWIALSQLIASSVTLVTLGRITGWADIFMGLKYAASQRR